MNKSIEVLCPNGHRLKGSPKLQGKQVRCPKCQAVISIPADGDLRSTDAQSDINTAVPSQPGPSQDAYDPFGLSDLPAMDSPAPAHFNNSVSYQPPTRTVPVKPANSEQSWLSQNIVIVSVASGVACLLLLVAIGLGILMLGNARKREQEFGRESPANHDVPVPTDVAANTPASAASLNSTTKPDSKASSGGDVPTGTFPNYAPAHAEGLIECPLLQEELAQHIHKILDLPEKFERTVFDVRGRTIDIRENGFSSFLLVTPEEHQLLMEGKSYEPTKRRIELLKAGLEMIVLYEPHIAFGGTNNLPLCKRKDFSPTAVGERLYADRMAVEWRQLLRHFVFSKKLDKASCAIIREVEDTCFGEDSIFKPYLKRWTDIRTERKRLTQEFARIAQAMSDFASKHGQLPNDSGAPALTNGGLSWRVALLPFLGHQELYARFHLDEAWDSDHNQQLVAEMPEVFLTRTVRFRGFDGEDYHLKEMFGEKPPEQVLGLTSYQLIIGPNSIFGSNQRRRADIADVDKKIMFVVGSKSKLVPWTQPSGVAIDKLESLAAQPYFYEGTVFCTFDGRGRFQSYSAAPIEEMVQLKKAVPASEFEHYCRELSFEAPEKRPEFYTFRYRLRSRIISIERKK